MLFSALVRPITDALIECRLNVQGTLECAWPADGFQISWQILPQRRTQPNDKPLQSVDINLGRDARLASRLRFSPREKADLPEPDQLGSSVRRHQNIQRVQIVMRDPQVVDTSDSTSDQRKRLNCCKQRNPRRCCKGRERLAIDELAHAAGLATKLHYCMNRWDIVIGLVRERRQNAGLPD
jgi:hypothetical protein